MEEKRRLKRRHLFFYLRIFNQKNGELIGYLGDITPEGIMVISENPIETNRFFKLRMDLPGSAAVRRLEFEAKSIWSQPDLNPDFYDTGLQLFDVSKRDMAMIEDLISDYGFRD